MGSSGLRSGVWPPARAPVRTGLAKGYQNNKGAVVSMVSASKQHCHVERPPRTSQKVAYRSLDLYASSCRSGDGGSLHATAAQPPAWLVLNWLRTRSAQKSTQSQQIRLTTSSVGLNDPRPSSWRVPSCTTPWGSRCIKTAYAEA